MLRHGPRRMDDALKAFVMRCRELREMLDKAQTPEEVDAINRQIDESRKAFEESRVKS